MMPSQRENAPLSPSNTSRKIHRAAVAALQLITNFSCTLCNLRLFSAAKDGVPSVIDVKMLISPGKRSTASYCSIWILLYISIHSITAQIVCIDGTECSISCNATNCAGKIIDASDATSLTIECTEDESCYQTTIKCPTGSDSECNIECPGYKSCHYATINGTDTSVFNILCTGNYGCSYSQIYAGSVTSITSIATSSVGFNCVGNNFYFLDTINVTATCIGAGYSEACYANYFRLYETENADFQFISDPYNDYESDTYVITMFHFPADLMICSIL